MLNWIAWNKTVLYTKVNCLEYNFKQKQYLYKIELFEIEESDYLKQK